MLPSPFNFRFQISNCVPFTLTTQAAGVAFFERLVFFEPPAEAHPLRVGLQMSFPGAFVIRL